MKKDTVVLLSGGMDSTISLFYAITKYGKENLKPISFLYGQSTRGRRWLQLFILQRRQTLSLNGKF